MIATLRRPATSPTVTRPGLRSVCFRDRRLPNRALLRRRPTPARLSTPRPATTVRTASKSPLTIWGGAGAAALTAVVSAVLSGADVLGRPGSAGGSIVTLEMLLDRF